MIKDSVRSNGNVPIQGLSMCVSNLLYFEMVEEAREVVVRLGFSE
jgi:hypothetical protein